MWASFDMGSSHMNEVIAPNPQTNTGGLFIGDWTAADDIKTLVSKKINFVLTALPHSIAQKPEYVQNNIKQLVVSADDMPSFNMAPHFDLAFEFISNALQNGNVLVHCAAGISRSSTLTMVYLMRSRRENYDKCLAFLRTKRPICTPNYGFQKQLREYAKQHGLE